MKTLFFDLTQTEEAIAYGHAIRSYTEHCVTFDIERSPNNKGYTVCVTLTGGF